MAYAKGTTVTVSKTRHEIEAMIAKQGADEITVSTSQTTGLCRIGFCIKGRNVTFEMKIPFKNTKAQTEKEERRMWRALLLCIKAKFECVESGIATFDEEFLAYVVADNGLRFGDAIIHRLPDILSGKLKGLLPAGVSEG